MLTIFLHRTAFPNANNLKAVLSIVEMSVKKERLSIENVLQDSFTKKTMVITESLNHFLCF